MSFKRVRFSKNKTAAMIVAILMSVSMLASSALLPNANAQAAPNSLPTYSYINVAPDPTGVGQQVTLNFWLAVPLPGVELAQNMTILVTKPDGTTETLGPFTSDLTGGTFDLFTPSETGNYTFQMHYGGQVLTNAAYKGTVMEPSTSTSVTLTVQSTPVTHVPFTALPTTYWQTPINAENVQNWYALGGPWLGMYPNSFATTGQYNATGNFNPYTTAPTTAHILWTKLWAFGGAAGGDAGGTENSNYFSTSQYQPKFAPVTINGFLYSTWYPVSTANSAGIQCINLYNGQTQWILNTTNPLLCGQVLGYFSPNQYGYVAYIWTQGNLAGVKNAPGKQEYNMYDAMTGNYVLSIVNGTTMTLTVDPNGNLIGYYVNSSYTNAYAPTLNEWNSTQCINGVGGGSQWSPPQNGVIDFARGIMYSIPLPTDISGVPISPVLNAGYLNVGVFNQGGVIELTSGYNAITFGESAGYVIEAGFDANTGQLIWIENRTTTPYTRLSTVFTNQGNGAVYVDINFATYQMIGYSILTGKQLWTNTLTVNGQPPNAYGVFDLPDVVANGVMYIWSLGGDIWAVNMTTGNIIWTTTTTQLTGLSGTETPYGIWPLWDFTVGTVAGGMLFLPEGHEYNPPLFHGAQQLAINITNGQLVWSNLAFDVTATEVSYGIMTTLNAYDNQLYAYGMGPSRTTVTAPNVGVTTATPITITGTVTDVSAGASQEAVAANFPNGLPCVSDASMSNFMASVYEQQPMPTNITGVPVTIAVTDSNGNCYDIGTTTTTPSGSYSLTWTPTIPGNFTVTATFAGTQSYYASSATTGFYASAALASAPTATPVSLASTQSYILGIGIATIITIIIIGAVLAILMLRKRP